MSADKAPTPRPRSLRFRDDVFNEYFSRPEFLRMIERKFGQRTLEHVSSMTKIKLKRRILGD